MYTRNNRKTEKCALANRLGMPFTTYGQEMEQAFIQPWSPHGAQTKAHRRMLPIAIPCFAATNDNIVHTYCIHSTTIFYVQYNIPGLAVV